MAVGTACEEQGNYESETNSDVYKIAGGCVVCSANASYPLSYPIELA